MATKLDGFGSDSLAAEGLDLAGVRRRSVCVPDLQSRESSDGFVVFGHASVVDEWYTLYESRRVLWRERIAPGAFDRALREKHDVRALFNHEPTWILARTTAGNLALSLDARGLLDEFTLGRSPFAEHVAEAVALRNVTGQSFAFGPTEITSKELDDAGRYVREDTVEDLTLYDVGPVTHPAYKTTDVGIRSRAEALERRFEARARHRAASSFAFRLRLTASKGKS